MYQCLRASLVLSVRTSAVVGLLAAAGAASADTFVCEVVAPSSASNVGQLNLPLAGTFIGNYDATTNPGGTQTRPGLFGGSGNNPISFSATIVGDAGFSASPIGSLTIGLTPIGGMISGLQLELTGGTAQEFGITLNINYQTFRTFAPNSTFPGGFTIPVPVAGGQINSVTVTQTESAMMVVGAPDSEGTPFMALVPVEIVIDAEFSGAPVGGDPQAAVVPVMGRYTVSGSTITTTSSLSLPEETIDLPALPAIENQAFPLPTVLPPGGTANLLLSGAFSGGTISTGLSVTLVAQGELEASADINGDGVVNAADLGTLLAAWGSSLASCDLDGNGIVNGVDLAILLTNWG
jgi:hypothetical protein